MARISREIDGQPDTPVYHSSSQVCICVPAAVDILESNSSNVWQKRSGRVDSVTAMDAMRCV